mmetsp:Transcript_97207/g.274982  ORF Transcript_97207/g.274982 Transcript_97207/m.274982 type:complete len:142 (+) Transcript_97207:573-998(+)
MQVRQPQRMRPLRRLREQVRPCLHPWEHLQRHCSSPWLLLDKLQQSTIRCLWGAFRATRLMPISSGQGGQRGLVQWLNGTHGRAAVKTTLAERRRRLVAQLLPARTHTLSPQCLRICRVMGGPRRRLPRMCLLDRRRQELQ